MGKALLSEAEFSRFLVTRARRERPDIRVKTAGTLMLLIEPEPGRQRMISLNDLYHAYCEAPLEREEVVSSFLSTLLLEESDMIRGSFEINQTKILPQVVPPSLLEYCRRDGLELAAFEYVGGLAIAFVVDEPERYAYLHRQVAENWGVDQTVLLTTAIANLQRLNQDAPSFSKVGAGEQLTVFWETFDGYDASRILLTQELNQAAACLPGNPVIGIPHRDYLVMFSDLDEEFASLMTERIREQFEAHPYPITPRLLTLVDGNLAVYEGQQRRPRLIN